MHGDDVRISLNQEATVGLDNGFFGKVDTIQFVAFVVDFAFRRVHILGPLFVSFQYSPAKGHDLSAERMDRKDDTPLEAVGYTPVLVGNHQSGLLKILFLITILDGFLIESIAICEAIPQLKFANCLFAEAALGKIAPPDGLPVNMVVEYGGEIFLRPGIDNEHTVPIVASLLLFVGQLALMDLDVIFFCKVEKGIVVAQLFMFHDELHRRSSFPACETFANVFGRGD